MCLSFDTAPFFLSLSEKTKHTRYEKTIHILNISVMLAIDYLFTAVR